MTGWVTDGMGSKRRADNTLTKAILDGNTPTSLQQILCVQVSLGQCGLCFCIKYPETLDHPWFCIYFLWALPGIHVIGELTSKCFLISRTRHTEKEKRVRFLLSQWEWKLQAQLPSQQGGIIWWDVWVSNRTSLTEEGKDNKQAKFWGDSTMM